MAFFVFHTWIISERLFQCTHLISCRLRNISTNSVQIRKESDMKGVVIVSACRTTIGIFGGALKHDGFVKSQHFDGFVKCSRSRLVNPEE